MKIYLRALSARRGFFPSIAMKKRTITAWLILAAVIGVGLIWFLGVNERGEEHGAGGDNKSRVDSAREIREEAAPTVALPAGNAAWQVIDPESVDELPEYKEVVAGRALVRISEVLQDWQEGDEVLLAIPQLGGSFDGVVERVDDDLWGNRSYTGLLKEKNGRDYRFVITVGPENVFAQLGTSQGTFELVASDEIGWLMASRYMDQHVDYSQPDYYIVEDGPSDPGDE